MHEKTCRKVLYIFVELIIEPTNIYTGSLQCLQLRHCLKQQIFSLDYYTIQYGFFIILNSLIVFLIEINIHLLKSCFELHCKTVLRSVWQSDSPAEHC